VPPRAVVLRSKTSLSTVNNEFVNWHYSWSKKLRGGTVSSVLSIQRRVIYQRDDIIRLINSPVCERDRDSSDAPRESLRGLKGRRGGYRSRVSDKDVLSLLKATLFRSNSMRFYARDHPRRSRCIAGFFLRKRCHVEHFTRLSEVILQLS